MATDRLDIYCNLYKALKHMSDTGQIFLSHFLSSSHHNFSYTRMCSHAHTQTERKGESEMTRPVSRPADRKTNKETYGILVQQKFIARVCVCVHVSVWFLCSLSLLHWQSLLQPVKTQSNGVSPDSLEILY